MATFFKKRRFSLAIFCFFIVMFLLKMPGIDEMSSFSTTLYAVTYSDGFLSRAFVGSVIFLFTDFLSARALWIIIAVATLFVAALSSLLLGFVIEKCDESVRPGAVLLCLLFLSTPTSLIFLFKDMNFGRFDVFLIGLTLLCVMCAGQRYLRFLCPLLCTACILTHQVYLFTYMPIAGILLLYSAYKDRFSRSSIAVCAASYSPIIALFIKFQFFPSCVPYESSEQMTQALSRRCSATVAWDVLEGEYFSGLNGLWKSYVWPIMLSDSIPDGIYTLLILLPFFILLFCLWRTAFKACADKFMKFILILCMASPCAPLVAFLILNDYGRWFAALIITQITLFFYLVCRGEECVTGALEKMTAFFSRRRYIPAALLVYIPLFLFSASFEL